MVRCCTGTLNVLRFIKDINAYGTILNVVSWIYDKISTYRLEYWQIYAVVSYSPVVNRHTSLPKQKSRVVQDTIT